MSTCYNSDVLTTAWPCSSVARREGAPRMCSTCTASPDEGAPPLSPRVRGYVAAPAADMVAHTVTPARALDGAFGQAQEKPRPQLGSAHHGKYGVSLSSPRSRRGMGASSTLRARHVRVSRGDDRVFLPRPDHRLSCPAVAPPLRRARPAFVVGPRAGPIPARGL